MKVVFTVQGEGRGHMTQAIAVANLLRQNGHELVKVFIGKSEKRVIPGYFFEQIKAPVETLNSPNFIRDSANKGIRIFPTIWHNLKHRGRFFQSMKKLKDSLAEIQPDLILNFYEMITGMTFRKYGLKYKMLSIGHQFFLRHPSFVFPTEKKLDRFMLNLNSQITSQGTTEFLALSFREEKDYPAKKLRVVPPLLRKELFELNPEAEDFLLIYLLNPGYGEDIIEYKKINPDVQIHCFWDHPNKPEKLVAMPGLTFHQINDKKFLDYLSRCKGYMSTAGFESINEAMYLGKPVFLMPTDNHFEQLCNAHDAVQSGAGIWGRTFDIDRFLAYIPNHKSDHKKYKAWVDSAKEIYPQIFREFDN